jgi:dissimilatory sulfite reductase related protein
MPIQEIAGKKIELTEDGFLKDPAQWTREVASELAKPLGITLTDAHWKVIEFIRKDAAENGGAPNVRRLTKLGGVPTKDLYDLFPGGPAKNAARIAGYPKPAGCV